MSEQVVEAYDAMVEELGNDKAAAISDYVGAVSDEVYRATLAKVKAALGA